LAANAPEVTASTATSTEIRLIPLFKIVPLSSQALIATRRERRLAWDLHAALAGRTVALPRWSHHDPMRSFLGVRNPD
jgi:hypothetical protein